LHYIHSDHLGSLRALSDSNGYTVPTSIARYLPFGGWRTEPSQTTTDRGFTGHHHNNTQANDLGLIYMNARYYDPTLGRFLSADTLVPDPANPQSLNRYTYVENRPLNFVDPTGHCAFTNIPLPDGGWTRDLENDSACWEQYDAVVNHFLINGHDQGYIERRLGSGEFYQLRQDSLIHIYDRYRVCGGYNCSDHVSRKEPTQICNYWESCYEPLITHEEMMPDAVIFPAFSGSLGGYFYGVAGEELILNRRSNEVSVFGYSGEGTGLALEADVSFYGGLVWNLEQNSDYSGPFSTLILDMSALYGVQMSFFWSTGTLPFTGGTWGFSAGPSGGGGLGLSGVQTEFVCHFGCE